MQPIPDCRHEVLACIVRQDSRKLPTRITVNSDIVSNLSVQLGQGRFVPRPNPYYEWSNKERSHRLPSAKSQTA